ncbi:MAG: type IV toxin-antitoxin system AbiEi family antitoxin domain-containing protein, partial [Planctomycetota bacterium JB042]
MAGTAPTARPAWEAPYRVAESQAGYFTTAQAAEAGISTALIAHHLGSNTIRRVRRGIYRLTRFPMSD